MMRVSHWWQLLLRTIDVNVVFVFWFLRKLFFISWFFTLDAVEDATLPPTTLGTHDGVQTLSAILCSSCIWCHRRTRRTSLRKPLQFQDLRFSDFPTLMEEEVQLCSVCQDPLLKVHLFAHYRMHIYSKCNAYTLLGSTRCPKIQLLTAALVENDLAMKGRGAQVRLLVKFLINTCNSQ